MAVTHADMPQLLKALEEIYYQWQLFAVQLGVATKDIHAIEVQGRRKDLSMCLQDALGSWFAMTETKHTWWHVCEAVEMCDNNRLADHLRTKYKKKLNEELDELEHIGTLMAELGEMVPEWTMFCLQLGVSNVALNTIDQNVTPKKCTWKMLTTWIDKKGEEATIHEILKTLRSPVISNPALAKRLEENNDKVKEILSRPQPSAAAVPSGSIKLGASNV